MKDFKATLSISDVEQRLKTEFNDWKQKKLENSTVHYSSVPPLLKVGEVGMFDIVCRASCKQEPNYQTMRFEDKWEFDGGYNCDGSCNRKGGFKTVQDVIDFGVSAAKDRYIELGLDD